MAFFAIPDFALPWSPPWRFEVGVGVIEKVGCWMRLDVGCWGRWTLIADP